MGGGCKDSRFRACGQGTGFRVEILEVGLYRTLCRIHSFPRVNVTFWLKFDGILRPRREFPVHEQDQPTEYGMTLCAPQRLR